MRQGSRIVTVSSIGGIRGGGLFGTAAYAASKGAVIALTKNAARVLGPKGITVNCVAPGPTDTPMNAPIDRSRTQKNLESLAALGRFAAPDEIGQAIVWLLSDEASFVSGATLVVDGGHRYGLTLLRPAVRSWCDLQWRELRANVRFVPKADIMRLSFNVRFWG